MLLFGLIYGSWMFDTPFNIQHFIFGFFSFSQFGSAIFKSQTIFNKRRKICEVLSSVPTFYSKKDQENYKIRERLRIFELYRLRSIAIFCFIIVASLGVTVVNIVNRNFEFSEKLPFDTSNVFVLSIAILWMHLANISYQATNVVTETFQYGTVTILSMEFRILAQKFEHLKANNSNQLATVSETKPNPSTSKNTKRSAQIKLAELKPLIDKHNQLFEIRNNLLDVHCTTFHIRFLLSSFQLCFLAFQITFKNESRFFYILELAKNLLNIFFQCYFGQMFKDAGLSVLKAVQKIDWENIKDMSVKRYLMMIMMRSQKSIAFRILETYEITVAQFTTILTSAYSYYTLCLQVFR